MSPKYLKGSEYERAHILYEHGKLGEARQMAEAVPEDSPDYKSARRLVREIGALSVQLARKHVEIAEECEKAGIYPKALEEYRTSLSYAFNPLVKSKADELATSLKEGRRSETVKKENGPEFYANLHYMKGKFLYDSRAYGKAIDEFTTVLKHLPNYMNTKELLARAKRERDKAVDKHLKNGIGFFQAEEMEKAIREWDIVLEMDSSNKTAADYKYRAEVILERLKSIQQKKESANNM